MYCYRCGNKFDPKHDRFCVKCGLDLSVSSSASRKKKISMKSVVIGFIVVILSFFSPFAIKLIFGECGVVTVSRAISELEEYALHLQRVEDATIQNKRPPAYLIAQLEGNVLGFSWQYDGCVLNGYRSASETLTYAVIYFSDLPPFEMTDAELFRSYGGIMAERKNKYESSLRDFYKEIQMLKNCHPFCGSDFLFEVSRE
jgi:hypothetical protein